jgi:hypothetical protein
MKTLIKIAFVVFIGQLIVGCCERKSSKSSGEPIRLVQYFALVTDTGTDFFGRQS